jgi:hypothetical protein
MRRAQPQTVVDDSDVACVSELIERLLVDLARLGFGDDVDFDYVSAALADELRGLYPEGLPAGWVVDPDYREFAEVQARFSDADAPGRAVADVVVDDRSLLRAPTGLAIPLAPRRYRLVVTVDLRRRRITDLRCGEMTR